MKKKFLKFIQFLFKSALICVVLISILSAALVGSLRWIDPPTSRFIVIYEESAKRKANRQWVNFDQISWHLPMSVIASEDQQFPQHIGFDWRQIKNAFQGYLDGKRLRGASTISQQTIKNLFLTQDKTFSRKGIEAWFTFWLELTVPKKRILEIYLNIAQFSKTSFGASAAANDYFGISADQLNASQARLLATCLPAPSRCQPNNPGPNTIKKTEWIETSIRQLGGKSVIDAL